METQIFIVAVATYFKVKEPKNALTDGWVVFAIAWVLFRWLAHHVGFLYSLRPYL